MDHRAHAGVGRSTLRDPLRAGREAAVAALLPLAGRAPGLVLVFATTGYDQAALLAAVAAVAGDAPLSGCSAEGVITPAGGDEVSHAVAVLAIAHPALRFQTFQVEEASRDPAAAAGELAAAVRGAARGDARLLLLFPDGVTLNCGRFLEELERRLDLPIELGGGSAGTQIIQPDRWRTFQYHGARAATDAVSAVLISGDVEIETLVSHGCEPLGAEHVVTASDGARVAQLDGRPAFEVLRTYLADDARDLSANQDLHLCVGVPLPPAHQEDYGPVVVRAPMQLEQESGAVFFTGGDLPEGCRIQMARRDLDRTRERLQAAAQALAARRRGERPLLALQFDCCARGRVFCGDQADAVGIHPLQRALGPGVPWAGFYTFGEIAPLAGRTYYHACTVALFAVYPRGGAGAAG